MSAAQTKYSWNGGRRGPEHVVWLGGRLWHLFFLKGFEQRVAVPQLSLNIPVFRE